MSDDDLINGFSEAVMVSGNFVESPDYLLQKLMQYGDAESAIAIYKQIAGIIKAFEDVQKAAKAMIEDVLRSRGELNISTPAGKAAYTQPKVGKLNQDAWKKAMIENPDLLYAQTNYDAAKTVLDVVQEPYKELPAPSLRIS